MTLISLIGLSVAMVVLAASPGPGVFATVARSLSSGFRPALAVISGIVIGDIVYLMFAVLGLSIIAQSLGKFFIIVKIGGGIYLFCLGLKMWAFKPSFDTENALCENQSFTGNLIAGLLITLSNPKVILFYCGFLPTFIDLSILNPADVVLIVCVVSFVLSAVLIAYAYLASRARKLISSTSAVKKLNRSAGGVMMATGILVASRV